MKKVDGETDLEAGKKGGKTPKKLDRKTKHAAGSKTNDDVSGTEYDEACSEAETETDSRLDGRMKIGRASCRERV